MAASSQPSQPSLDDDLAQYSASNLDAMLESKRRQVEAVQRRVEGPPAEPEPEPEPEQRPVLAAPAPRPPPAVHHVKVSLANVRRFPTLARYTQLGGATHRQRPASARFGQPPNLTPNMRDLHNTRMLPQTDYEIIPPKVVSDHADFEQRMRTTAPVNDKPKFYPCNASAARRDLANSGSASCLPPSPPVGPAWGFSGSPRWQPSVRQTIGGQDVPESKAAFRPCSASAARDQIKGRVTLWSPDERERRIELRRQREVARDCATAYVQGYPTAHRAQPRLCWAKAQ